jgi:hypothetical protein
LLSQQIGSTTASTSAFPSATWERGTKPLIFALNAAQSAFMLAPNAMRPSGELYSFLDFTMIGRRDSQLQSHLDFVINAVTHILGHVLE